MCIVEVDIQAGVSLKKLGHFALLTKGSIRQQPVLCRLPAMFVLTTLLLVSFWHDFGSDAGPSHLQWAAARSRKSKRWRSA